MYLLLYKREAGNQIKTLQRLSVVLSFFFFQFCLSDNIVICILHAYKIIVGRTEVGEVVAVCNRITLWGRGKGCQCAPGHDD